MSFNGGAGPLLNENISPQNKTDPPESGVFYPNPTLFPLAVQKNEPPFSWRRKTYEVESNVETSYQT